ncbi:MAG: hypothetical protein ABIH25_03200 [Candidatus Woesearchaeota archaeon]
MLELNENLCILAGAHAADGHLSRKGCFSIKDEDENNIKLIAGLIQNEFNFFPRIFKSNNENSYGIQFQRKDFYKYFKDCFNFPFGPKTYTVGIPKCIIGNKDLERAFVVGSMTFESSVNINKSIGFSVVSKKFRDDLRNILVNNGMKVKSLTLKKGGNRKLQYGLWTSDNMNPKELETWLDYYIIGSEKWFKILELSNGFFGRINKLKDAKRSFNLTYFKGRKVNIIGLISIIKKLKQVDINYLYKKLGVGKTTIMKYLNILNDSKIIKRNKNLSKLNINNLSKNTHITLSDSCRKSIFDRINQNHGHDAKICRLLRINDFVYCRWRNGERGIPLGQLKTLLKLGKIPKKTYLNTKRIDREIIEFNDKISEWRVPWRPWLKYIKLDKNNLGVKKWIIKN